MADMMQLTDQLCTGSRIYTTLNHAPAVTRSVRVPPGASENLGSKTCKLPTTARKLCLAGNSSTSHQMEHLHGTRHRASCRWGGDRKSKASLLALVDSVTNLHSTALSLAVSEQLAVWSNRGRSSCTLSMLATKPSLRCTANLHCQVHFHLTISIAAVYQF